MNNSMQYLQIDFTKFLSPADQVQFDLYIETWNRWAETFNRGVVDILDETELILPGDYKRVLSHMLSTGIGQIEDEIKDMNSILKLNEVIA